MNRVKDYLKFTNQYLHYGIKRYFIICGIAFVALSVVTYFATRALPAELQSEIYNTIGSVIAEKDVVNSDGSLSFAGILQNNVLASLVISIIGFIPFLFLPMMYVAINAAVLGAVMAIVAVPVSENVLMLFVKYILPHGIFELPAVILSGAIYG